MMFFVFDSDVVGMQQMSNVTSGHRRGKSCCQSLSLGEECVESSIVQGDLIIPLYYMYVFM